MFKLLINSISSAIGLEKSKAVSLSFEEARSRISDGEYSRLYAAFKRVVTCNSHMSKQSFKSEVLGDLFPPEIAEYVFTTCGGTSKGILFKDLISALVVLTKGTLIEKIRFIFTFYSAENNGVIYKDEFLRFLQDVERWPVPDCVYKLFFNCQSVECEVFCRWLLDNRNATSLSCWLLGEETSGSLGSHSFNLSDDHETPTFYQTLAGVTHLDEEDIIELEKRYWQLQGQSRTGKMDVTTLLPLVCPPLPESIVQGFLDAFDENRDGHIDFKEMACGISAAARGPPIERQKFCFKIFDQDKDGLLSPREISHMITVMKSVLEDNLPESPKEEVICVLTKDDKMIIEEIFKSATGSSNGMSLEEYLVWSLSNPLPERFLTLIYQVCQVVLGLKPLDPIEEYDVVSCWLTREEKRGIQAGQTYYLVSTDWWTSWLNYSSPNGSFMSNSDSGVGSISGSIGSHSNSIASFSESSMTFGGNGANTSNINSNASNNSNNSGAIVDRPKAGGGRTCWSSRNKSSVENSVAIDSSQNVVVTAISSLGESLGICGSFMFKADTDVDIEKVTTNLGSIACSSGSNSNSNPPSVLSPHAKASSSSLSLVTLDSSRSTCSSSPSPMNSPVSVRRQMGGSLNGRSPLLGKRRRPGAIDNSCLLGPSSLPKVPSLTNEGGRLRRGLEEGRDFKAIPQALWNALQQWYGVSVALPRQVVEGDKKLELELYPMNLFLYKHQNANNNSIAPNNRSVSAPVNSAPWAGMAGMYGAGASALSTTISYVQSHSLNPPKRILAYTATFSRKTLVGEAWEYILNKLKLPSSDSRFDLLAQDDLSFVMVVEEEYLTLEEASMQDNANILLEMRNKDQTWPEEIGSLASSTNNDPTRLKRTMSVVNIEKGLTGLNNLGNTCFMNSAIQCASNTRPLTLYFLRKMHLYELNRTNPIGMKGHIAKRYADLITDMWSGTLKTIAPFKLRYTIGKYAPRFSGFQQNDAQELLAFLLDGLHEDLNRVAEKPYVELKDSNNRPDVVCAQEAWENHLLRNKSILVDLFHGQLKSSVRCQQCDQESVRFDPFNYLSLPLPMESYILIDAVVIRQNESTPKRYGILCLSDGRVSDAKTRLSQVLSGDNYKIAPEALLITEVRQSRIVTVLQDHQLVKGAFGGVRPLYVYEITRPSFTSATVGSNTGDSSSQTQSATDHQIQKLMTSVKNQSSIRPQPASLDSAVSTDGDRVDSGHSRENSFSGSSCNSMTGSTYYSEHNSLKNDAVIVVIHRKMIRQEYYFLATQKSRPVLFGLPLVVPYVEDMTHLELYKFIWSIVGRLVSPLPPSEGPNIANHAQDCDDSLGYEYPFVLRLVSKEAEWACGRCPWFRFCRGCPIACTEMEVLGKLNPTGVAVAIDWDPTALHLRYQATHEMEYTEHQSLSDAVKKQTESVALQSCLAGFTKEEQLGEDEKYFCAKCNCLQLATKKLQIWRLPPILIIHLKRFLPVQGRWIKSQKIVDFPFQCLVPTPYLADAPRRTCELSLKESKGDSLKEDDEESKTLFPLQDFHQHRLLEGIDPFQLGYRLYAIVCHSGMMGGGHYVAYAKGPTGKWYCFNDSSCKEVAEEHVDVSTAYMLFYERIGLDANAYMPRIDPKTLPVITDDELEAEENDLKKLCIIA